MLKLALRNIKSKPWRTVATVMAIAVAIAMIFAMLSFRGTVYDYIGATETAVAGSSSVKISAQSSSDRVFDVAGDLMDIAGVEEVVPSLYLYAEIGGEYVQARGFENSSLEKLQKIEIESGELNSSLSDNVVISKNAAKHFGVSVGDSLTLALGTRQIVVYVGAIAKVSGYFLDDSPYLIIGNISHVSKLIIAGATLCNEIYVKTAADANVDEIVTAIKNIDEYADMQVAPSHDYRYIDEQTTALTAPVVLAGAAVLLLAVAINAFIFLMGEKEKIDFIARLRIVGATSGQIFAVFLIESTLLACVGGLVGSAVAVGIFALIIRLTLKTLIVGVNVAYLFAAAVIGIVSAIVSSLYPIFKSMKGSIRQNQTSTFKPSKRAAILPIVSGALAIISIVVECLVYSVAKYFAIISLVLVVVAVFSAAPYALRLVSLLLAKGKNPSVKTAAKLMPREKRFARSTSILTIGIAISVMLFMAWNITTTVFDGYIKSFENFVFVSNIKSNVDVNGFNEVEGVEAATKMVWQKSELKGEGFENTVNLLGSADVLDMINFEFITAKDDVKTSIVSNHTGDVHPCAVDISLNKLYGVKVGDTLELVVKDKTISVSVAGFLKHNLFNGNYIVVSAECLKDAGVEVDTVLIVAGGDVDEVAGNIKQKYASQNYYAVSALEAYKWDKESTSAVFNLVGTLAVVVGVFILIVAVFATIVGRGGEERSRTALLNAGMSKSSLLGAELFEHIVVGALSFLIAFAISVLLTVSLIHALALFGLYFEFVYNAWIVAVVGVCMAAAYAICPLVLNFKNGYKLKRE